MDKIIFKVFDKKRQKKQLGLSSKVGPDVDWTVSINPIYTICLKKFLSFNFWDRSCLLFGYQSCESATTRRSLADTGKTTEGFYSLEMRYCAWWDHNWVSYLSANDGQISAWFSDLSISIQQVWMMTLRCDGTHILMISVFWDTSSCFYNFDAMKNKVLQEYTAVVLHSYNTILQTI